MRLLEKLALEKVLAKDFSFQQKIMTFFPAKEILFPAKDIVFLTSSFPFQRPDTRCDCWKSSESRRCQQKIFPAGCLGETLLMGGGANIESVPRCNNDDDDQVNIIEQG